MRPDSEQQLTTLEAAGLLRRSRVAYNSRTRVEHQANCPIFYGYPCACFPTTNTQIIPLIPAHKWHAANAGVVDLKGDHMSSFDTEQGKALITSKVFWGVIIMAIGVFAPKLQPRLQGTPEMIADLAGMVLTLVGRLTASQQITGLIRK